MKKINNTRNELSMPLWNVVKLIAKYEATQDAEDLENLIELFNLDWSEYCKIREIVEEELTREAV